ncbi:transposase [Symbiopectobacterium sp. RP]|uniref:transposase n=1 Tax=Symbiopectobacterium sp. RP TaxID=3248553 RepID=UPI003D2D37CD
MVEYLPTYSPDLNPIEHKWAQAKKEREWLRYRDFVLSPYGVIKIKSLFYTAILATLRRFLQVSDKAATTRC